MDNPPPSLSCTESECASSSALRILIADDEAPYREMFRTCIENMGHSCSTAGDGLEALDLLAREAFDIVITDISMPRMDGLQLLVEVRRTSPETDVIVITGYTDRYTCMEAITAGAIDFLAKPFSLFQFEAKLARVIREKRLVAELHQEIASRRLAEKALLAAHEELEARVEHRTRELGKANRALAIESEERRQTADALMLSEAALAVEKQSLVETNTALKVLLAKRSEERQEMEAEIIANLRELVDPYLLRLRKTFLSSEQALWLDIAMRNLDEITTPIMRTLHAFNAKLTPSEIQVANLIRQGLSSKKIAESLNLAPSTVDVHRRNIRRKSGLTNSKLNLRTMLSSSHF